MAGGAAAAGVFRPGGAAMLAMLLVMQRQGGEVDGRVIKQQRL
jgi:hypothetical protein